MNLSEYAFSLQMRDVIKRMVAEEVDRLRPRYRYGVVESIDRVARKCAVIYNGDTGSVLVSMGSIQPSTVGQVVRIEGIGTDKFITDVIGDSYLDDTVQTLDSNVGLDRIARLLLRNEVKSQFVMTGGGNKTVESDRRIKWDERFIAISVSKDAAFWSTDGYFDVTMPADGTVIPNASGGSSVTVTGGYITLPTWGVLWYIPPIGANHNTVAGNFRITHYQGTDASWSVPDEWIMVCAHNNDPKGPSTKWGNGQLIDHWRIPAYLNSWTTYNTDFEMARYRKLGTGQVEVQGLIRGGTPSTTLPCFQMPVGFRPGMRHMTAQVGNAAAARVDYQDDGNVYVVVGSTTYQSVTATYYAEK